jgi:hypothetical protein
MNMPTVQIWVTEDDYERLSRLKAFYDWEQEQRFDGREFILDSEKYHGRRRRIRRKKINNAYIFREALKCLWLEKEEEIIDFEG